MPWPDKRFGINHNFPFDQGCLINMLKGGSGIGRYGSSWTTGAMWDRDTLDDNTGLPNTADCRTNEWGGFGTTFPPSSEFSGPYVLRWTGNWQFQFTTGTYTVDTGLSTNYTQISNGRWQGTDGYVVFTYNSAGGYHSAKVISEDQFNIGNYVTDAACYRLEDEARYLAGKMFRAPYLQQYVDWGFIRFMNWQHTNDSIECRFEHRRPVSSFGWNGADYQKPDTWGSIAGTNQFSIANKVGFSPPAMKHGEVVQGRLVSGQARGGSKTVTSISKATNGRVVATAHGFLTGDKIVHIITAGMVELHQVPCTITVIDANTYDLNINTTAFTAFTAGTAMQYVTLNRGGLGDYPIIFSDGLSHASAYSSGYIKANDYQRFSFDKYMRASTTINGAWIFSNPGASGVNIPKQVGIPIEAQVKFMVELKELQDAQGKPASNMWICVPHRGLLSVDPDYTLASNWGVNAVDVCLNGANGWPGLPPECFLMVEGTNEDWNTGGSFAQTHYQTRAGFLRNSSFGPSGFSSISYYSTLRKMILVNDIKSAFPGNTRIKHIMGGWGGVVFDLTTNAIRIDGHALITVDPWNTWGVAPMVHFDAFAFASYYISTTTFHNANAAPLAAAYDAAVLAGDVEEQEAVCSQYVVGVLGATPADAGTVKFFAENALPQYLARVRTVYGKDVIGYEGGWERSVTSGTTPVNNLMKACKRSFAYAATLEYSYKKWLAATGAYSPADYINLEERWGHAFPHSYAGGVEGAGLDKAYRAIETVNQNKEIFRRTFKP